MRVTNTRHCLFMSQNISASTSLDGIMFPSDLNKLLFDVLLSIKPRATICSLYTSDYQNDINRE